MLVIVDNCDKLTFLLHCILQKHNLHLETNIIDYNCLVVNCLMTDSHNQDYFRHYKQSISPNSTWLVTSSHDTRDIVVSDSYFNMTIANYCHFPP